MEFLENGFFELHSKLQIRRNQWLMEELVKGLKEIGVEVWTEESDKDVYGAVKTILHIKNSDGKRYAAGLVQTV